MILRNLKPIFWILIFMISSFVMDAQNRLLISRQLQQSVSPYSMIITDATNNQGYLTPGTNGFVLQIVGGIPTWIDPAGSIFDANNGVSLSGITVQLGQPASGSGAADFTADRYQHLSGFNYIIGGTSDVNIINIDGNDGRIGFNNSPLTTSNYYFTAATTTGGDDGLTINYDYAPSIGSSSVSAGLLVDTDLGISLAVESDVHGLWVSVGGVLVNNTSTDIIVGEFLSELTLSTIGSLTGVKIRPIGTTSIANDVVVLDLDYFSSGTTSGDVYGIRLQDIDQGTITGTPYGIVQQGTTPINWFSGLTGIGVSPANYTLDVEGLDWRVFRFHSNDSPFEYEMRYDGQNLFSDGFAATNSAAEPRWTFRKSRGSQTTPTDLVVDDKLFQTSIAGKRDGSASYDNGLDWQSYVRAKTAGGRSRADLAFNIRTSTNEASTLDLGFYIDEDGGLQAGQYGIGTFTGTETFNLSVDATGNIIETAISSGGTLTGADNGVSVSGTTVQLGHPATGTGVSDFTANRYLFIGAFDLEIGSTGNANAFYVDGSTGNIGVGTALPDAHSHVYKSGTLGLLGYSNDTELILQNSTGVGEDIHLALVAEAAGTAGITFGDETDVNEATIRYLNSSGKMEFITLSGAGQFDLENNGRLNFNQYGSGTHSGTATFNLEVDVNGNIIETVAGGGGGADGNYAENNLTADANRAHTWAGFNQTETFTTGDFTISTTGGGAVSFGIDGLTGSVGVGAVSSGIDFLVQRSNIGGFVTTKTANTDNTSGASHARHQITNGGASGGDSYVNYVISTVQDWASGIDNSDADKFKFTTGGTPSTGTTIMTLLTTGNVGIKTASPGGLLHVQNASTGGTAGIDSDDLIVENTGDAGITILSGSGVGDAAAISLGNLGNEDGLKLAINGTETLATIGSTNASTSLLFLSGNGVSAMTLGTGQNIQFHDYGGGANTGTATYFLAVDAGGNIIEETAAATTDNIYVADGTLTGDRTMDMAAATLNLLLGDIAGSGDEIALEIINPGGIEMRYSKTGTLTEMGILSSVSAGDAYITSTDGTEDVALVISPNTYDLDLNDGVDNTIAISASTTAPQMTWVFTDGATVNTLTMNEDRLVIGGQWAQTGKISATLTASQNNWAPTGLSSASFIRIDGNAAYNITGINSASFTDGTRIVICNFDSADDFTFMHEDAASTAANRFDLETDTDYILLDGACMEIIYDQTSSRIRILK